MRKSGCPKRLWPVGRLRLRIGRSAVTICVHRCLWRVSCARQLQELVLDILVPLLAGVEVPLRTAWRFLTRHRKQNCQGRRRRLPTSSFEEEIEALKAQKRPSSRRPWGVGRDREAIERHAMRHIPTSDQRVCVTVAGANAPINKRFLFYVNRRKNCNTTAISASKPHQERNGALAGA